MKYAARGEAIHAQVTVCSTGGANEGREAQGAVAPTIAGNLASRGGGSDRGGSHDLCAAVVAVAAAAAE